MLHALSIYNKGGELILQFGRTAPKVIYDDIMVICDCSQSGKLRGLEIFLYLEPEIILEKVSEQFYGYNNIEVDKHGLMYIWLRPDDGDRNSGFGRSGSLGFDEAGYLRSVRISWDAPGAATPHINPQTALKDIAYQVGEPSWE